MAFDQQKLGTRGNIQENHRGESIAHHSCHPPAARVSLGKHHQNTSVPTAAQRQSHKHNSSQHKFPLKAYEHCLHVSQGGASLIGSLVCSEMCVCVCSRDRESPPQWVSDTDHTQVHVQR